MYIRVIKKDQRVERIFTEDYPTVKHGVLYIIKPGYKQGNIAIPLENIDQWEVEDL